MRSRRGTIRGGRLGAKSLFDDAEADRRAQIDEAYPIPGVHTTGDR